MPTVQEYMQAGRRAVAAGDFQSANELAEALEAEHGPQGQAPQQPQQASLDPLAVQPGGQGVAQPLQSPSFAGGLVDIAATMGSSMFAEPIAGIAGIATGLLPDRYVTPGAAADVVRRTRELLTVDLGSEGAALLNSAINSVPESIRNTVAAASQKHQQFADIAAQALGPAAGAAVQTLPTAAAELVGLRGGRQMLAAAGKAERVSRGKFVRELKDAAPTVEQLRDASKGLYRELDNSAALVKPERIRVLALQAADSARKAGAKNPKLAPGTQAAIDELREAAAQGAPISLEDLVDLRTTAQQLMKNPQGVDASGARAVMNEIDGFFDDINAGSFVPGGQQVEQVGTKLRTARELYRRAKRSELLEESINLAREQASGFENGIRVRFRQILNNKKEARFFKPEELAEMSSVVQGKKGANLFKKLGKLGVGEGQATSMTTGMLGAYLGFTIGGPGGAAAMLGIGIVSRKLATRLTQGGADMADQVIRAGSDGQAIASIYLRNIPRSQRNPQDLASLLVRPDVQLDGIKLDPITTDAINRVNNARTSVAELVASAAAGSQVSAQQQ